MTFRGRVLEFVQRINAPDSTPEQPRAEVKPMVDDHGQPLVRRYNEPRRLDRAMNEFIGLLRGVLADGPVTPEEAIAVGKWLLRNSEMAGVWPISDVTEALGAMLAKGKPTGCDCERLTQIFTAITGPDIDLDHTSSTPLPLTEPPPDVTFAGRVFLLTGRFEFGTRKECEAEVELRGGTCMHYVTRKLNYVVIGTLGSEDWVYSTFGRKIQQAQDLARRGPRDCLGIRGPLGGLSKVKAPPIEAGNRVRITCPHSKYLGVIGTVFTVQESSGYAIVQMPKGTELKIERIMVNTILAGLKDSKKPKPVGDPQWFPLWWLTIDQEVIEKVEEPGA